MNYFKVVHQQCRGKGCLTKHRFSDLIFDRMSYIACLVIFCSLNIYNMEIINDNASIKESCPCTVFDMIFINLCLLERKSILYKYNCVYIILTGLWAISEDNVINYLVLISNLHYSYYICNLYVMFILLVFVPE